MTIDSHHHIWNFDKSRHAWIDESMSTIQKSFLPEDLALVLDTSNVEGTVLVQVDQSLDENSFLLSAAENNEFIKGVVGWVDLRSKEAESQIEQFANHPKSKGIRHIVQSEPEGFMLSKLFQKGISLLKGHQLTYDLLLYPPQINEATLLIRNFEDQPFVVDHIAKPYIKNREIKRWRKDIASLAMADNVYCKVSGMVTEAKWDGWSQDDFIPYLDVVFEAFGIDRIMFGSDWPVCLVAATYSQVINIVKDYMDSFSLNEKNKVFGENAIDFYSL